MIVSHDANRGAVGPVLVMGRSKRETAEGVDAVGVGALMRGVWDAMSFPRLVEIIVLRRRAST